MNNLWENTPNQASKFRTKNGVEVNDESRGAYNFISEIKFNFRDKPFLNDNGAISDFPDDNNNNALFKFKTNIAGRI